MATASGTAILGKISVKTETGYWKKNRKEKNRISQKKQISIKENGKEESIEIEKERAQNRTIIYVHSWYLFFSFARIKKLDKFFTFV